MPKINVYLPDDLADAVRDAGVPISAVCQRALELAVTRITAIRRTALDDVTDDLRERLPHFTDRAATAVTLAVTRARDAAAPRVGTDALLHGILAEGGNLAVRILASMEIDQARLATPDRTTEPGSGDGLRFSDPAAAALELTVAEATALGHNYVGCEHLLIGLAVEPDGAAGRVLRAAGADARSVRRTVTAALAGYTHLRAQPRLAPDTDALMAAVRRELHPLVTRIERLEARLSS
ncbi:Clp protease N-terminal domain-containing protein [Krasilnikovia sp. M28-CT-15]|uniref:Clp protease N-terminal domain-containing protein n=1 Tax=Krasilnikovia sp. M28-CT-15 TaxID=3373540 RepID=UPI00399C5C43